MGDPIDEAAEFDREAAEMGLAEDVAAFDAETAGPGPAPAPVVQSDPTGMDYLLSLAEGASLGHGRLGERIGNAAADLINPRPEGTELAGKGLMDSVPRTMGTQAAEGVGRLATAIPATIAAGTTRLGQGLVGAAQGGLDAHGRGESVLGGAAVGAGSAMLGGEIAKGLGQLAGPAMRMGVQSTGTRAGQIAGDLAGLVPGKGTYGALAQKALEPGLEMLGKIAPAARGLGQLGAGQSGRLGDEAGAVGEAIGMGASTARAQEPPVRAIVGEAIPTRWTPQIGDAQIKPEWDVQTGEAQIRDSGPQATQAWAVESVLYQGTSGLPRQAEQQLTEAVMSGDPEKLATATFLLSGKHPKFASALQRQVQSLSREED